jgi:hypothetical protein
MKTNSISSRVIQRISQAPASAVWTPGDFYDLGGRDPINKTLQRMATNNTLRRIDRGLYDQPRINPLTNKLTAPDYRMVIDAISRRDQIRVLIDGMTAANDLSLTTAVPAKVILHTDARIRPICLDKLVIQFKLTAPSKLYWADRPAMRIVQALYWFRDSLKKGTLVDESKIKNKILDILKDPKQGTTIQDDLVQGLYTLPTWMQDWIRDLLA